MHLPTRPHQERLRLASFIFSMAVSHDSSATPQLSVGPANVHRDAVDGADRTGQSLGKAYFVARHQANSWGLTQHGKWVRVFPASANVQAVSKLR